MSKKILTIIGLSALLLVGCSHDAEYFSKLKQVERVEVIDTGTRMVGKISYTTITYLSNETGEKIKIRFEDGDEDYGFDEFYDSAKIFEDEIYVDLVINNDEHIVSIVLSEEVK